MPRMASPSSSSSGRSWPLRAPTPALLLTSMLSLLLAPPPTRGMPALSQQQSPFDLVQRDVVWSSEMELENVQRREEFPTQVETGEDLAASAGSFTVEITNDALFSIPKTLYGMQWADIRHSGDGGLYSEQLQNRALQIVNADNQSSLYPWEAVGSADLDITNETSAVSWALPNSFVLSLPSGEEGGLGQYGYWGINVTEGAVFNLSFWVKSDSATYTNAPLSAALTSHTNSDVLATSNVTVASLTTNWQQINTTLTATTQPPDAWNNFTLTLDASSSAYNGDAVKLYFAMFTLEPQATWHDEYNGLRPDFADAILDLQPTLWRFPGGNNMEGPSIPQRWIWNNTLGPLVDRPGHQGTWGYANTDGLGLKEYLDWCEESGMTPHMAVWAGYALNGQSVPEDELGPYIQTAIDQINFVIGDASTNEWAAYRAALGHPEPYSLQYVEIGNEDFFSTTYTYRWQAFAGNLTAAFPQLSFIATSYPDDPPLTPNPGFWDLHYYNTDKWYIQNSYLYDTFPRDGTKYCIMEWGVTSTDPACYDIASCDRTTPHNMTAASAEAMFAIGFERNSDIIFATAYGVLAQRIEAIDGNWTLDLITFNTTNLAKSTAYYLQRMFGGPNLGDVVINSTAPVNDSSAVIWGTSYKNNTGEVIIKLANANSSAADFTFSLSSFSNVASNGTATLMTGPGANTLNSPNEIAPTTSTFTAGSNFTYSLPGYSVAVLVIGTGSGSSALSKSAAIPTLAPANAGILALLAFVLPLVISNIL